jgi:hypothetical protein
MYIVTTSPIVVDPFIRFFFNQNRDLYIRKCHFTTKKKLIQYLSYCDLLFVFCFYNYLNEKKKKRQMTDTQCQRVFYQMFIIVTT